MAQCIAADKDWTASDKFIAQYYNKGAGGNKAAQSAKDVCKWVSRDTVDWA